MNAEGEPTQVLVSYVHQLEPHADSPPKGEEKRAGIFGFEDIKSILWYTDGKLR